MAHTLESVKAQLQSDITASNNKTGASDTTVHDAMTRLINGFGVQSGITPTGTKQISSNGTHDVTNYAYAEVNVQNQGITPSGTKEITTNGEHDVTNFAKVLASIPTGMNARVFTTTVSSDVTSGDYTIAPANDFIKSIRSNPNAFVLVLALGQKASTAMYSMWLIANFTLFYTGTNARNAMVVRTTTTANNITGNYNGLTGANYSGHLNVESDGSLKVRGCNATYPVRAGEYLIIAGVKEML